MIFRGQKSLILSHKKKTKSGPILSCGTDRHSTRGV